MPTIAKAEIEVAAFWEQEICLDCGHVQSMPDGEADDLPVCEECSSSNRLPAQTALAVLALVEEDDE